jgi:hypothetical protein
MHQCKIRFQQVTEVPESSAKFENALFEKEKKGGGTP